MMIADDQIEHYLMENRQLRDEKDDVIEELRTTIRMMEERDKRWKNQQSKRLEVRDVELRRYRFRIRELLAFVSRIISDNNDNVSVDTVMTSMVRNQVKELTEENIALREANEKMTEEITKLCQQVEKHHQQNQEKVCFSILINYEYYLI